MPEEVPEECLGSGHIKRDVGRLIPPPPSQTSQIRATAAGSGWRRFDGGQARYLAAAADRGGGKSQSRSAAATW